MNNQIMQIIDITVPSGCLLPKEATVFQILNGKLVPRKVQMITHLAYRERRWFQRNIEHYVLIVIVNEDFVTESTPPPAAGE